MKTPDHNTIVPIESGEQYGRVYTVADNDALKGG